MKILFAVLVVLNIAFFAWQVTHDDEGGGVTVTSQSSDGVSPLMLLSERPDTQETGGGAEIASAPEKKKEAKVPPALTVMETVSPTAEPDTKVSQSAAVCYKVGPFQDEQLALDFTNLPQLKSLKTVVQAEVTRRRAGFWVKWPEELTLAEARSVMAELRNRGVSDMSISPQDNKRYVLSLGIFGTRYYMEQRVDEMTALGYTPIVEDRYKDFTRYWLHIKDGGMSLMEALKAQVAQMQGLTLQDEDCQ